jgi:hypothetical protein
MTTLKTAVEKATAIAAKNPDAIPPDALSAVQKEVGVKPALALARQSFKASADGLAAVWAFESENKFGQSVAIFLKDIFVQVALPLLSLLWLVLSTAYRTARKPETKAAIIARYESLKAWASPEFGYERDSEQLTLPTD